jgi:hypothetical protein
MVLAAIVQYAKAPNAAKSLMPNARQEFGAMAPIMIADGELKEIAEYIFTFSKKRAGNQGGR